MRKTQILTMREFQHIFQKLDRNFLGLLKNVGFKEGDPETICGDISRVIQDHLTKMGIKSTFMSGTYYGRGTNFSGGHSGTGHCWVELTARIRDGYHNPLVRVIIDGAYAQFFPDFTPRALRKRVRLMIFMNDKTALRWYRPDDNYQHIRRRS